jgi:CMP-N,N'-diacetyllegionaminic acid synthase
MGDILAVIPARAGSKRLPGKNKRHLGGKPLIMWSLELAMRLPQLSLTLVSTDDEDIAKICRGAGATVPWLRPASLATDTATTVDVVLHALDWYEQNHPTPEGILLLQPTSPFRKLDTVSRGIDLFRESRRSVVGVSQCQDHPMWSLRIKEGCLTPFMEHHGLESRSQDLPVAYTVNGAFYLISPEQLRNERSFAIDGSLPLVMSERGARIDIDDHLDWQLAEAFIASHRTID